jgi:hypothetical protein
MQISGAGSTTLGSFPILFSSLAPSSSTSVVAGARNFEGIDDTMSVVATCSVCNVVASDDFSGSGARVAQASPDCYEPRAKDFLCITAQ